MKVVASIFSLAASRGLNFQPVTRARHSIQPRPVLSSRCVPGLTWTYRVIIDKIRRATQIFTDHAMVGEERVNFPHKPRAAW